MNYGDRSWIIDAGAEPGPPTCVVWDDSDKEAAIARFRATHDWPDDGNHPLTVVAVGPKIPRGGVAIRGSVSAVSP